MQSSMFFSLIDEDILFLFSFLDVYKKNNSYTHIDQVFPLSWIITKIGIHIVMLHVVILPYDVLKKFIA